MGAWPWVVCVAIAMAGCSQPPLAEDATPEPPSTRLPPRPAFQETSGTVLVSSEDFEENDVEGYTACMYVGGEEDSVREGLVALLNASMKFTWEPQTPATDIFRIDVAWAPNVTAEGASPLWLNWTANKGPDVLPLQIRFTPTSPFPFAVQQEVGFHIKVGTSAPIEAFPGPCDWVAPPSRLRGPV